MSQKKKETEIIVQAEARKHVDIKGKERLYLRLFIEDPEDPGEDGSYSEYFIKIGKKTYDMVNFLKKPWNQKQDSEQ